MFNMLIYVLNAILFRADFSFFMRIASRICTRFFIVIFIYYFCIIHEDLFYIEGFEFVSVFFRLCH